eukprot:CAMPEP_0176412384 /NCGR_PEP_ID=MMETSP0127-20121128/4115_1 /TAXON_ID=938130 /ORGANISM="Platyophrya macrostoma, Strain WH" /LENGTH=535 /DNA_ID=CAMNT_0017792051 /DNA_START=180 /DNA_END=1787 /DNA_ORIENTATION=+
MSTLLRKALDVLGSQTAPANWPAGIPLPALADDTPSRHPCKIRITSAQKRFMFDPYKAQVTLDAGVSSEDSDDVDDSAFDTVLSSETQPHGTHFPPTSACTPSYVMAPAAVDGPVQITPSVTIGRQASPPPAMQPPFTHAHSVPVITPTTIQQPRRVSPFPSQIIHSDQNPTEGQNSGLPSNHFFEPSPHSHFSFPSSDVSAPSAGQGDQDDADDGDESSTQAATGAHFTNTGGCFRMSRGNVHHVLVRFKFSEDVFVVPPVDRGILTVGDLVVVEGDRGENIGQVAQDLSQKYEASDVTHKGIIRRALNKDRKKYYHARRKDAVASKAAQQLVKELGLKMHILDVEFQTDLAKLTIYFRALTTSGENIDFRELQRTLFKQFRCRIWLVNWDEDETLQRIVNQQLHTQPKPHEHCTTAFTITQNGKPVCAAAVDATSFDPQQQQQRLSQIPPAFSKYNNSAGDVETLMVSNLQQSHQSPVYSVPSAGVAFPGNSKFRTTYTNTGLQAAYAPPSSIPLGVSGMTRAPLYPGTTSMR